MEKAPPFTILIDQQEKLPLTFNGFDTKTAHLKTGDYSIEVGGKSWGDMVAIERKSYIDCWGSMSSERARFERCVKRLGELHRAAIVIECSITKLAEQPSYIQRVQPASVVGGLISWACRYRIPIFFADDRERAARVVLRFLASYYRLVLGDNHGPPST